MIFYDYETTTGFKFHHLDVDGEFLYVESNKLPQTLEFIRAHGPIRLTLNAQRGFALPDLRFLQGIEHLIEGLAIVGGNLDLQGLEQCVNLKYLQLDDDRAQPIDFGQFPHLSHLRLDWKPHYGQATFPDSLTAVHLWGYRPQTGFNETSLHNLRNVTTLSLVQAAGQDLSLLQHCGPLTRLDVAYGRSLTDISALARHAGTLQRVDLDKCMKISDFSVLSQLTKLQWLNVCDCGAIPSVSFVQHLPELRHLVFLGTTVNDGNLSFLQGIEYVRFNNKPHYSLKVKHFE